MVHAQQHDKQLHAVEEAALVQDHQQMHGAFQTRPEVTFNPGSVPSKLLSLLTATKSLRICFDKGKKDANKSLPKKRNLPIDIVDSFAEPILLQATT